MHKAWAFLILGLVAQAALPADGQQATRFDLPIYFVENRGQCHDDVAYVVRGRKKTVYFTERGLAYALVRDGRTWGVHVDFGGSRPGAPPTASARTSARFSYFRGARAEWRTAASYSALTYRHPWPGIDVSYRAYRDRIKTEFVVAPGADPGHIRLVYRGADVTLSEDGALVVTTPCGGFRDEAPAAYQEIDGTRREVPVSFDLERDAQDTVRCRFVLGRYDPRQRLVIDPAVLVSAGYIGGSRGDLGWDVAVDRAGNIYVTGQTSSTQATFPVKTGPDLTFRGGNDGFVAKITASGQALVYCGYIGGSSSIGEHARSIAVDAAGAAYVVGDTWSAQGFPVTVGPDLTHNGLADAFIAKVNPLGTGLDYCGYIGGADGEVGYGVAVDAAGNAYVSGHTYSPETSFPVRVGPDLTFNGQSDAFVAKVAASGVGLVYCGYVGGSDREYGRRLAVDAAGAAHLVGETESRDFPVRIGPGLVYGGGVLQGDGFVAKVSPNGAAFVYSGYLGGAADDDAKDVAIDPVGNAHVVGQTRSDARTFPVRVGPDLSHNGGKDAYLAVVAPGGVLLRCGYVGGTSDEVAESVGTDTWGNSYLGGESSYSGVGFPRVRAPSLTGRVPPDGFVTKVAADGKSIVYSGFVGGGRDDGIWGLAVDRAGVAYVVGYTQSDERTFPVRVGPDLTFNGIYDAFVAKVGDFADLALSGSNSLGGTITVSLSEPASAGRRYQVVTSMTAGTIMIDTRPLGVGRDDLFDISVRGAWPQLFGDYAGTLDQQGKAQASISIPTDRGLIGLRLHTGYVILDPRGPSGIRSVSEARSFNITT